jgi:hypothetical protein
MQVVGYTQLFASDSGWGAMNGRKSEKTDQIPGTDALERNGNRARIEG